MGNKHKPDGLLPRTGIVSFRLSAPAHRELAAICIERRRTPSDIVQQVVSDWLVQHAVMHGYRSEA